MTKKTLTVPESKFTRGEKCIFIHLVITFTLILVLIITYGIHLYMVRHTLHGIFNTRRSSSDAKRTNGPENLLVGYLYFNLTTTRIVCNTLLVNERWSLSTAHCVAIRTDPDMAYLLFSWKLKYKLASEDTDPKSTLFITLVKRSIAHSLFERETFGYNVGLLEHTESYPLLIPNLNSGVPTLNSENRGDIFIIGWNHSDTDITDNDKIELNSYDAHKVSHEKCLEALSPVTEVRNYEYCVWLKNEHQTFLDYGAVVFGQSKVIGIFSWGERIQKELPMVIINITLFQDWLNMYDNIIS